MIKQAIMQTIKICPLQSMHEEKICTDFFIAAKRRH